ncbi:MAG: hypothetical protein O6837_09490 [Deltaproteobacteria bacterium]|nr:hypothetical protein [Deltaproteobacteria bacterium]
MRYKKGFVPVLFVVLSLLFTADGISVEQWADPPIPGTSETAALILTFADEIIRDHETCGPYLTKAAKELVKKDFEAPSQIKVQAANDFICYNDSEKESMANAVFTLEKSGYSYFGMFHLHFTKVGQLRSAASYEDIKWTRFKKDDEWKKPWCELIRLVYPKEMEEQGCIH